MADFTMNGLGGPERLPLRAVFNEPQVDQVSAVAGDRAVFRVGGPDEAERHARQHAEQAYREVEAQPEGLPLLAAAAIMTTPVITLRPESTVDDALALFEQHGFRHIPIVSAAGQLVGLVSERELWRYLAGGVASPLPPSRAAPLQALMLPRVLAASSDTDVRHIVRLFVEQRVGALPVADNGQLQGIVTRNDVLSALMRHYRLHVWT